VIYYHGIRNKLYHEGDGVTVSEQNAQGYAELAVALLNALLEVDLLAELRKPELEASRQAELQAEVERMRQEVEQTRKEIQSELHSLEAFLGLAAEKIDGRLTQTLFKFRFEKLSSRYVYEWVDRVQSKDGRWVETGYVIVPEEVVDFGKELVELLDSYIDDPDIKSQLFAPIDIGLDRELETAAVASWLIDGPKPTPMKLYARMVEILSGHEHFFDWDKMQAGDILAVSEGPQPVRDWPMTIDAAERYPNYSDRPDRSFDQEHKSLNYVLDEGKKYIPELQEIRESVYQWLSASSEQSSL
jgi:hypothetical protein